MKRLLFISLALLTLSGFAQKQPKPAALQPLPVQVFSNYVVRLISLDGGKYGYDILYQGRLVASQKSNPFTLSAKGLSKKEDAFKIAHWQVQQLIAGVPPTVVSTQPLPSALAKQLNITLD